jgi:hypothetical protein
MGRRDLYIFNASTAIPLVVFDANVGEFGVPVDVRQVPLARPALDLLGRAVGAANGIFADHNRTIHTGALRQSHKRRALVVGDHNFGSGRPLFGMPLLDHSSGISLAISFPGV